MTSNILDNSVKYRDCRHTEEDACAVKEAVQDGALDMGDYENYLKLKRHVEYQESLADNTKARERKRKHKQLRQ